MVTKYLVSSRILHMYALNFINVFIIRKIPVIKSIFAKSTKGRRYCQNAFYLNDDVQTLNNGNMKLRDNK